MAVAGEAEASSTATAGTAGNTAEQLATAGASTTTPTTMITNPSFLQQQLSVDSTSSSTEPADHPSEHNPAPTRQQNDDADDDRGSEEEEEDTEKTEKKKKKEKTEETASSSSSISPSTQPSPFVVAVLANGLPPRRARVLIDPSRSPAATSALAWQRVYGQTLLPKKIDWAYADGEPCSLSQEHDVQVLRVMADATLRNAGRCLVMRIRAAGEPWAPLPSMAYGGAATVIPPALDHTSSVLTPSKRARAGVVPLQDVDPAVLDMDVPAPSVSPSAAGAAAPATTTVKETYFDVDDSTTPRTVSTTSSASCTPSTSPVPGKKGVSSGEFALEDSSSGPLVLQSHEPHAVDKTDEDDDVMEDPYAELKPSEAEVEPLKSDCIWWLNANHPVARFFELATMVVIIISIFGFVLETIPEYRLDENGEERTDDHPVFFVVESCCIGWFTVEYLMRMYATPGSRWKWARQPMNAVDLIAIVPYYISLGLDGGGASSIAVIRVLRLTRVTRLFKISRHSQGLQDMIMCVTQTRNELILFFFIIMVASVLFGSAIFYCEKDSENSLYVSIPESMWWAVITMTTVGYGDISPETVQGKFVGVICASLGVALLAIPAGIFISEFMRIHESRKREEKAMLKHDIIFGKIGNLLEDVQEAVEQYRHSREHFETKLKEFHEKQLQKARRAGSQGSRTPRRSASIMGIFSKKLSSSTQMDMTEFEADSGDSIEPSRNRRGRAYAPGFAGAMLSQN